MLNKVSKYTRSINLNPISHFLISSSKNIFKISSVKDFSNTSEKVENLSDKNFKTILNNFRQIVNELSEESDEKLVEKFASKLTPEQKLKVENISEFVSNLNEFQYAYLTILKKEHIIKNKKISVVQANADWTKLAKLGDKTPENINPAYFKQQEYMANFVNWLSKQKKPDLGLGPAAGATAQPTEVKKEEKKEDKKEEKKEKTIFDIELTSFDAAKKVSLIKEVRGYTNLGLKESKELVEKAPTIIMKGVKKEDTEAIVKKLTENGAKITLK